MSDELFESTLLELNSRLEESQSSMQDLKDELESLREEKRLEKGTEMEMMRASLEELSQELGREKMKRAEEEEKVSSLREIAEESRKALMRLQMEQSRRDTNSGGKANRRQSLDAGFPGRRRSSLGLTPPVSGLGFGIPIVQEASNRSSTLGSAAERNHRIERNHRLVLPERNTVTRPIGGSRSAGPTTSHFDFFEHSISKNGEAPNHISSLKYISNSPPTLSSGPSSPPPTSLKTMGRNNSVAVFDDISRRSSLTGSPYFPFVTPPTTTPPSYASSSKIVSESDAQENLVRGLRIELAAAEEGRRASNLCVQALKEFINEKQDGISLPPLPTDEDQDEIKSSRWTIRIPSLGRDSKRSSISSATTECNVSPGMLTPAPTLSFGSFSFSGWNSKSTPSNVEKSPTANPSPRSDQDQFSPRSDQEEFTSIKKNIGEVESSGESSFNDSCSSINSELSSSPQSSSPHSSIDTFEDHDEKLEISPILPLMGVLGDT